MSNCRKELGIQLFIGPGRWHGGCFVVKELDIAEMEKNNSLLMA
jgi:hypothetical protein